MDNFRNIFKHQKNIILNENERLNNNDVKKLIEIINDIDAEDNNLYYENNLESNFHFEDKNIEEKESDEDSENFSLVNGFSGKQDYELCNNNFYNSNEIDYELGENKNIFYFRNKFGRRY